jgi:hypothetical protein
MNKLTLFLILVFLSFGQAQKGAVFLEPVYDELEGPQLVEKLLDDGRLEQAQNVLYQLKQNSLKTTLLARLLNESGQPHKVSQILDRGFELARSYYLTQDWEKCSQTRIENLPELSHFKKRIIVECFLKSRQWGKAWSLMETSQEPSILELKFNFLIEHQLYGQALKLIETAADLLLPIETVINWSQKLPEWEKTQAYDLLIVKYPENEKSWLNWTEYQLKNQNAQSALRGFRKLAFLNSEYMALAGEALRTEGHWEEARYISILINSKPEGLKLKMNLALDRGDWFQLAGLTGPFERSSISNEENFIYALAYSHFTLNENEKAKRLSLKLRDPSLKQKYDQLTATQR